MKFEIKKITSEETRPLRKKILRPNHPYDTTKFPKDDQRESFHVGAFAEGKMIGTASIYVEGREGRDGWRIRGMAVEDEFRKLGIGRKLIEACIQHVKERKSTYIWFNARTPAIEFYKKCGFSRIGQEFDIPESGPHYVMEMNLNF